MTVTQTEATAATQWAASSAAAMRATLEREPWALVKVCVCASDKKMVLQRTVVSIILYVHTYMCTYVYHCTYVCM